MSNIIHAQSYFQVPYADMRALTDPEYRLLVELYALAHRYTAAAIEIPDAELSGAVPHTDKTKKRAREGLVKKRFIHASKGAHGIYTYVLVNSFTGKPHNQRRVRLPRPERSSVDNYSATEPKDPASLKPATTLDVLTKGTSADSKPGLADLECFACSRNKRTPVWQKRSDGSPFCVNCHPMPSAKEPVFTPPNAQDLGFTTRRED